MGLNHVEIYLKKMTQIIQLKCLTDLHTYILRLGKVLPNLSLLVHIVLEIFPQESRYKNSRTKYRWVNLTCGLKHKSSIQQQSRSVKNYFIFR